MANYEISLLPLILTWHQDHEPISDLSQFSVSHKMIVYHIWTIEICNWQFFIKIFLIAFLFFQWFQSRDIKTLKFLHQLTKVKFASWSWSLVNIEIFELVELTFYRALVRTHTCTYREEYSYHVAIDLSVNHLEALQEQ